MISLLSPDSLSNIKMMRLRSYNPSNIHYGVGKIILTTQQERLLFLIVWVMFCHMHFYVADL